MGGRRLRPAQAVDSLSEAIDVIRGIWDVGDSTRLRLDGAYHRLDGAKRGPAPAHDIGIWLGAYKPRMLRLVGAKADGWLPSLGYLSSVQDLSDGNAAIDEAARAAGRDPRGIRRLLNINGQFGPASGDLLSGPPAQWAEELTAMALEHGVSAFIVMADDPSTIELFGQEVAPAARELVASARGSSGTAPVTQRPGGSPAV
jgi:alkanesulfonate monooxygenase SsuD/methylene tetrahydromethanopterin reductase-like flavin-dependent oxidoreductase (luciferase family)